MPGSFEPSTPHPSSTLYEIISTAWSYSAKYMLWIGMGRGSVFINPNPEAFKYMHLSHFIQWTDSLKSFLLLGEMAHTCNPSYSGDRD
jgi:hypothetical protein